VCVCMGIGARQGNWSRAGIWGDEVRLDSFFGARVALCVCVCMCVCARARVYLHAMVATK
jgi:hypothetical protein